MDSTGASGWEPPADSCAWTILPPSSRFVAFGTRNGLASDDVAAIAEDRAAASTPRPAGGSTVSSRGRRVPRASSTTRLPTESSPASCSWRFATGRATCGSRHRSASHAFRRREDRPRFPPPVLVTGLSIGGVAQPITDLGQSESPGSSSRKNPLRIDSSGSGIRRANRCATNTGWKAPMPTGVLRPTSARSSTRTFLPGATGSSCARSPAKARFPASPRALSSRCCRLCGGRTGSWRFPRWRSSCSSTRFTAIGWRGFSPWRTCERGSRPICTTTSARGSRRSRSCRRWPSGRRSETDPRRRRRSPTSRGSRGSSWIR